MASELPGSAPTLPLGAGSARHGPKTLEAAAGRPAFGPGTAVEGSCFPRARVRIPAQEEEGDRPGEPGPTTLGTLGGERSRALFP